MPEAKSQIFVIRTRENLEYHKLGLTNLGLGSLAQE
jgi:hypothetical protein